MKLTPQEATRHINTLIKIISKLNHIKMSSYVSQTTTSDLHKSLKELYKLNSLNSKQIGNVISSASVTGVPVSVDLIFPDAYRELIDHPDATDEIKRYLADRFLEMEIMG